MEIAIQKIFLQLLLWLLTFIDGVFAVFRAVAGISEVQTAEGEPVSLGQYFLELPAVQKAFWVVLIASVGVCAVCAVVAVIKAIINAKGGEPKSPVKTAGQAATTTVVSLLMAMFMITGVWAADGLLKVVDEGMNGGQSAVMGAEIINISVEEGYKYDDNDVLGLNEYDEEGNCMYKSLMYEYISGGVHITSKSEKFPKPDVYTVNDKEYVVFCNSDGVPFDFRNIYNQKTDKNGEVVSGEYVLDKSDLVPMKLENAGWLELPDDSDAEPMTVLDTDKGMLDESVDSLFGSHGTAFGFPTEWRHDGKISPESFNFLVAYLCAIIILIALIGATLGLVKRLFDIVLLFIALPGIVATIPLDDGAKFKLWRETVVSKVFLAFGSVFAVNVFFIVAPSIWGVSIDGASPFLNAVLRLVLICGGALTISGGQLLFSRLLGTGAEESREMGQSARTLLGGATTAFGMSKGAGRLLFGTKNANGQRVGGLIKGGAGVAGTIGSGAVNAVGSLAGGKSYSSSKLAARNNAVRDALRNFSGSSGWFGKDKTNPNGNTLFGALGQKLGSAGGKFANSGLAARTGLNNGLIGVGKLQIENRHAAAQQSARDMITQGSSEIENAYSAAYSAQEHEAHDFGREVVAGFEDGAPSNMPAPTDDGSKK